MLKKSLEDVGKLDQTETAKLQCIGGSVDWHDRSSAPVVSWRSGQVNLGMAVKKDVGKNWSIHESLRDLRSREFLGPKGSPEEARVNAALTRLDRVVQEVARPYGFAAKAVSCRALG